MPDEARQHRLAALFLPLRDLRRRRAAEIEQEMRQHGQRHGQRAVLRGELAAREMPGPPQEILPAFMRCGCSHASPGAWISGRA